MRDVLQRLGTLALALLLVSTAAISGLGGPASPTGTAVADWSEECDLGDSLLGAAYNTITGSNSGCRWISGDSTDWGNLTASYGYSHALSIKDSTESYTTQTGNLMTNTRTVVASKAKIGVINDLNNGTPESVARDNVNATIRNYTAQVEANLMRDWNQKAVALMEARDTGVNLRLMSGDTVKHSTASGATMSIEDGTYTLINGSTMQVKGIKFKTDTSSGYISPHDPPEWMVYPRQVSVEDPDTGNWTHVIDASDYSPELSRPGTQPQHTVGSKQLAWDAQNTTDWAIDQYDQFVPEVYNLYEAGEINATDLALADPTAIAQEASTDLNSTGYYGYAAVQLAAIGASGSLNVSHQVTVMQSDGAANTTYNGTLFFSSDDGQTYETGTVYNLSNHATPDVEGVAYMVVSPSDQNESADVITLSSSGDQFRIDEATNTQTGATVQNTTVERYVYEDANATALAEEIERLKELREEYENQNSGGSGFGFDENGNMLILGVILALLAVVLLQK